MGTALRPERSTPGGHAPQGASTVEPPPYTPSGRFLDRIERQLVVDLDARKVAAEDTGATDSLYSDPYRPAVLPDGRRAAGVGPDVRPAAPPPATAAQRVAVEHRHRSMRGLVVAAGTVAGLLCICVAASAWVQREAAAPEEVDAPTAPVPPVDLGAGSVWYETEVAPTVDVRFPAAPADVTGQVTPGPLGRPNGSRRLMLSESGRVLLDAGTSTAEVADRLAPIGQIGEGPSTVFAVDVYDRAGLGGMGARGALDAVFGTAAIPAGTPFLTSTLLPGVEVVELAGAPDSERNLRARVYATADSIVVMTVIAPMAAPAPADQFFDSVTFS